MDEPESLAGLTLAARENLDNLIFVVNCNLQRLDGPVRGNGSIVQELERLFGGAGWNVIKLLWGSDWDDLFERDRTNAILRRLHETVDGELQSYGAHDGAYNRERFFNKTPDLRNLVAGLADDQINCLTRGGHDPVKIHAAFDAAVRHARQPTVILAQTKKGYGLGRWAESRMSAHQQKKLDKEGLLWVRDQYQLPLSDEDAINARFYRPGPDTPEIRYLVERRQSLGGFLPARAGKTRKIEPPAEFSLAEFTTKSDAREASTTIAFVRMLSSLLKNASFARQIVPVVADEARTFGMQSLFRQVGIYSYENHAIPTLPFYIFYSIFGFQRVDLIWAAADSRARGFLIGATSGRTTLAGEGLQHQDGTSHLIASTVPACRAYDPAFAYELAVILEDGVGAMLIEQNDVFYYLTTMNENYVHPPMPPGVRNGILRGMYRFREGQGSKAMRVQLLSSGAILREALAAADILEDWGISADVWSVTSFTELRRTGLETERTRRAHPGGERQLSWVEECLGPTKGPVIAANGYVRAVPDLIRTWVPRRYVTLGTDGYGRSDTRAALRRFFEVDRLSIAFTALGALVEEGILKSSVAANFPKKYAYEPSISAACNE